MRINFILVMMIPLFLFGLFIILLFTASMYRKKIVYLLAGIVLIFGIYNFNWVYNTVRTEPLSADITYEIYEIDKITTTSVFVDDNSYSLRENIEEIKENTSEYENILYREITSEEFSNKYLGLIDISFERRMFKNFIYVDEDTYKILTHGNILYEKQK